MLLFDFITQNTKDDALPLNQKILRHVVHTCRLHVFHCLYDVSIDNLLHKILQVFNRYIAFASSVNSLIRGIRFKRFGFTKSLSTKL